MCFVTMLKNSRHYRLGEKIRLSGSAESVSAQIFSRRVFSDTPKRQEHRVPNRHWLCRPAAPRVYDRVKKDCCKSFRGSLPKRIRKPSARRCVALERIFGDPVVANDPKLETLTNLTITRQFRIELLTKTNNPTRRGVKSLQLSRKFWQLFLAV